MNKEHKAQMKIFRSHLSNCIQKGIPLHVIVDQFNEELNRHHGNLIMKNMEDHPVMNQLRDICSGKAS